MPVLVRWQQGDGAPATVRCTEVRRHPLLPAHLQLLGVRGANDPEHPDLRVVALSIRASDVVYLCDCAPAQPVQPTGAAQEPAGEPSAPAPPAAPSAQPAPAQEPQRRRRARARTE